ncbi:MAG: CBS domain-containing protein, partial [Candidatus Sericytochromatia bacterium]
MARIHSTLKQSPVKKQTAKQPRRIKPSAPRQRPQEDNAREYDENAVEIVRFANPQTRESKAQTLEPEAVEWDQPDMADAEPALSDREDTSEPEPDLTPEKTAETAKKPDVIAKWETTKAALRQHYGVKRPEKAPSRRQKDPHKVVTAIMKRMRESRLGEDHDLIMEPPEVFAASEDGILRMSDVMTSPIVCVIDATTVEQLAGLFNKRHIMAVPIVHYQSRRFIGLVSMSDIFSYTFSQKILSTVQNGALVPSDCMAVLEQPVRDFIDTHAFIEVAPDCTVQQACELMVEKQLHHLVVTRNHKVKGIFSSFDALRILA